MGEVEELVARAAADDQAAWSRLVDRFAGLVWSVARSVGLGEADAADVCQTTWMRLAEHLDDLHDAGRVGAWLATTTRREAVRVSRLGTRQVPVDPWQWLEEPDRSRDDPESSMLSQEHLLAVQAAVASLPDRCRRMLMLLAGDPPASYRQLGVELGLPPGSIGPTRARCLQRLEQLLRDGDDQQRADTIPERTFP